MILYSAAILFYLEEIDQSQASARFEEVGIRRVVQILPQVVLISIHSIHSLPFYGVFASRFQSRCNVNLTVV